MENIVLHEVDDAPFFPAVSFDAEKGVCEISGESYMEETFKFYAPLQDWLRKFFENEDKPLEFNFRLTYFNTSSSRQILDLLEILKKEMQNGADVKIKWYYDSDDPDMEDEIEDFKIETGLSIELIDINQN
jgi:hypothetical protein